MTETMKKWKIWRDGDKDLAFEGKDIASVSDRLLDGVEQSRWNEVEIYKTKSGKYVVARISKTLWQGESESHSASICDTPEQVLTELEHENEYENRPIISHLAKKAIEMAAKNSEEFEGLLIEEI